MDELIRMVKERVQVLKKAIRQAENDHAAYPDGRLRVSAGKRQIRYYRILDSSDPIGEYIPKRERDIACGLAQKDYRERFLKLAGEELKVQERFLKRIAGNSADSFFIKLSAQRKKLINPYILTDELYAEKWQDKTFKPNTYMEENKIYETRRGDMVRSKSEAMIADMLCELGIPYHYEMPLTLMDRKTNSQRVRYPDFTLLKIRTREEVYLEHFGLLDDEEYLSGSLNKLDEYRANGIYPGRNLIFTYETENNPLDIKGIKKMLKDVLL
ncbi:MAG: hypothetical protein K6F99_03770 [Lachnospiraceae bacterium]|nr:hypothetical protein [Lachnospiraceae bacterium]